MLLFQILTFILPIGFACLSFFLIKKDKLMKPMGYVIVGLLFVAFTLKTILKSNDKHIYDMIFETMGVVKGRFSGIMPRWESLGICLISWLTAIVYGTAFTSAFYNGKGLKIYNIFVIPVAIVLNAIFFEKNIFAISGEYTQYYLQEEILLLVKMSMLGLFFGYNLRKEINEGFKIEKGNTLGSLALLPVLLVLFMPMNFLQLMFGQAGAHSTGYNKYHLFMIAFLVASFLIGYFALRKKDFVTKNEVIMLMAFSALYAYLTRYFYIGLPVKDWPLHICNTALFFMMIAIVFRSKGMFYFTYFINSLGALFAVLYPNKGDFFASEIVEFWSNHVFDLLFPFLGVAIGAFEKPKLKEMLASLAVFTGYFLGVLAVNCYGNANCDPKGKVWNVDFFFQYGDKFEEINFISKFAYNIKYSVDTNLNLKYAAQFTINGNNYYIYWLNAFLIYICFIGFSFLLWYLIDKFEQELADIKLVSYKTRIKKEKLGKSSRKEIKAILDQVGGKAMVKISHFSKRYGSSTKYAVKDFSLDIEDGEVFGFIGHNGAGKSTVIKSLVGIQSITEGTIEVGGFDIERYPLQAKLNIGYVSDNHAVYEKLTGREYINYVADLYQVPFAERDERIKHYSEMFGLTDALDREAKSYSHGMKQKLVVIASLIHNPKVWVLDEPLTGLDPTSSYQIKECIREHAQKGNIVFFSTHVIEVIEKLCTKIAIISHGELKGVYSVEELKNSGTSLESVYLKYVVSDDNRGNFTEEDIATTDAGMIFDKTGNN